MGVLHDAFLLCFMVIPSFSKITKGIIEEWKSAIVTYSKDPYVTATDFFPPNCGLTSDYGGWCNKPRKHFEMSTLGFYETKEKRDDMVPVQDRRINYPRNGGLQFTIGVNASVVVKIKRSKIGWLYLSDQPLSFKVTSSSGRREVSYNLTPSEWQFGQTFEGKHLR
ncbi:hypothetical protein AMTRI_Chr01g126420 [Amborella trichopoda]